MFWNGRYNCCAGWFSCCFDECHRLFLLSVMFVSSWCLEIDALACLRLHGVLTSLNVCWLECTEDVFFVSFRALPMFSCWSAVKRCSVRLSVLSSRNSLPTAFVRFVVQIEFVLSMFCNSDLKGFAGCCCSVSHVRSSVANPPVLLNAHVVLILCSDGDTVQ